MRKYKFEVSPHQTGHVSLGETRVVDAGDARFVRRVGENVFCTAAKSTPAYVDNEAVDSVFNASIKLLYFLRLYGFWRAKKHFHVSKSISIQDLQLIATLFCWGFDGRPGSKEHGIALANSQC